VRLHVVIIIIIVIIIMITTTITILCDRGLMNSKGRGCDIFIEGVCQA